MDNQILLQLSNKEVSRRKAYKTLFPKVHISKQKRAHFVKLNIVVPDEKGVSRFLAFLFFMPMPLFIVRFGLRFMKDNMSEDFPMSKKDLLRMISIKGIKIDIKTQTGEKIYIKTI